MTAVARGAAAMLLAAAACFHPNAETGQPCSANGLCPSGQSCDTSQPTPTCVPTGTGGDAGHDGGNPVDARTTDAPGAACTTGSACPDTEPVCDLQTGMCRGCHADAECATAACEESTGLCMAEAGVVYVGGVANNTGSACTRTAPCATIAEGLAAATSTRPFVAVAAGTYDEAVSIGPGSVAVVSGPGSGATATIAGEIVVSGNTGPYLIESVTTVVSGTCVQLETPVTVTLFGDVVGPCGADGVDVQGALVMRRSEVIGGGSGVGTGINQMGGNQQGSGVALDVEQTGIGAFATGIGVQSGTFVIRNDLLADNASLGIHLHNPGGATASVIDFVTIVDGGGRAISCGGISGLSALAITSSLFADNATAPSIDSNCPVSYSVWDDTSTPIGSNNGSGIAPMFVDAAGGNFHLAAGSPGINAADPSSTTTVDLDGAPRPTEGGFDCGAFQIP